MDGGADVVVEAGQRQLGGATAAARLVRRLEDVDGQARPGQDQRRRPARWARHPRRSASARLTGTSQRQRRRFVGPDHGHGALGEPAHGQVDLCVGRARVGGGRARPVAAPAMVPRPTPYSAAAWPNEPSALDLLGSEVGVVDEQVDVARQLQRRFVVLADALVVRARAPSGSGPGCRRATSARRSPGSRPCGRPCGERRSPRR